jgi:hypothetical protein
MGKIDAISARRVDEGRDGRYVGECFPEPDTGSDAEAPR